MSSYRRRAAVAFPSPNDLNEPIVDFSEWNDVPLLSPIHQNIFRPTSLQQMEPNTNIHSKKIFMRFALQPSQTSKFPKSQYSKESLQRVVDETHFSKNEVKAIYRAFKETSPNAVINKDILREKFAELFPHGDIEHYADLLFDTFDNDGNGTINFQEFVKALSILCRGTMEEKIEWLYKIYDPQDKGEISFSRLLYVITSMDDLMGRKAVPVMRKDQKVARAKEIFEKFDIHKRGKILKEDFIRVCKSDSQIISSISALYTILPG